MLGVIGEGKLMPVQSIHVVCLLCWMSARSVYLYVHVLVVVNARLVALFMHVIYGELVELEIYFK